MPIFKRALSIFLRISISIILLIFLFKQVDRRSLLEIIKDANKGLLFLAFFILFFNYLACLFRWEMLLKGANIHLPLKRIIISFAGGSFFSLFLPSTIGGDLVRSIDLSLHTQRPREVIATVFLDRLSGYIGLVTVVLLAVIFGYRFIQDKNVLVSVAIITSILISILLVVFNEFLYTRINRLFKILPASNIKEAIKDLHQEIYVFKHHKNIVINNLVLSFFIQAITPLSFYILSLSLGININVIYFFIFIPIIGAITLIPISIGGLGLRDATTIFFFAKAGLNKDLAFAMSLLFFFFILIYGCLGGLIYVLTVHHRRIQRH